MPSGQRAMGAPKTLEIQHSKTELLFCLPPPSPLAGALISINGTTILGHSSQKPGSHLSFLLLLPTLHIHSPRPTHSTLKEFSSVSSLLRLL